MAFKWFDRSMGDLEADTQQNLFSKRVLKVDPVLLDMAGYHCIRNFFETINLAERKLRKLHSHQLVSTCTHSNITCTCTVHVYVTIIHVHVVGFFIFKDVRLSAKICVIGGFYVDHSCTCVHVQVFIYMYLPFFFFSSSSSSLSFSGC